MTDVALAVPLLEFAVASVEADPLAPTPTLNFAVDVTDESDREIYTIALAAQVQIDGDRRSYDPETRARLHDLFGEPEQIAQTAGAIQIGRVEALVPSFRGTGRFTLAVPFSGDVELAATRYLASLTSGTVPLTFNFNGSIFYCGEADRLQITLVAWSCDARFRLSLADWRSLIERRYGAGGFVRVQQDTLDALRKRRTERGLPTFDAAIQDALQ
ncbi:MAG: DUF6084 family protein [Actinomycetota bacterium]